MRRLSAYIAIFVLAATHGAHAEEFRAVPEGAEAPVVDSAMLFTIEEVSVRGTQGTSRDVIPAQVLSGKELERLSTVSVADAIRYFSGAQIKDYGGVGGLKTVNIRSMGTQHVGVFYDGVQLGNAQNGQIDLGRFSMDNMEAISVYNGQRSDIFQTARDFASSSAVYLTSRRPIFTEGRRGNLRLLLKGGSFGTINPSVLAERRLSERVDAQLSAEYLHSTGRYRFTYRRAGGYDTTQVRQNGDVGALRVEGGLFGRLARGDWRAKLYLYNSERGYPGASVREEPGRFRHEDRQWDTNIFAQGSVRQFLGPYSLMINAKYSRDRLRYLSDPESLPSDDLYRQQEAYLSVANEVRIAEWWRVSVAGDVQYNTLEAELTVNPEAFPRPERLTALAAAATAFEWGRFKAQASLLYTHLRDRARVAGGEATDRNRWSPTVVASYKPFRATDLTLRAFYKRIFRMPTLNDLYYTMVGTPELDPENTTQYNLGAVWRAEFKGGLHTLEVQVDGYLNQIENKIVAVPGDNQFRWTMTNLGRVEIRGVDAAVRGSVRLGRVGVNTLLNYTHQRAQDVTDTLDPWYGGQIPYIPRHSGSAVVGAAWGPWNVNYSFIYTGERYDSRANIPENYILPWYTSDVSLSRTVPLGGSSLRITGEINNLLNQQYEVVRCYPMPGVNFNLKISWTL
jgi:outer membrane cobalamin receptor